MKIKYDGMEKPKNIKKEKLYSRLIRYLFLVIFLVAAGFTAYNYFGTKGKRKINWKVLEIKILASRGEFNWLMFRLLLC
mgnify:CR=1 FL=1